jgi:predicted nucleic acid-binding protein
VLNDFDSSARRRFPDTRSAADARAEIRCDLDCREPLAVDSALQQRCVLLLTENLDRGRQLDGVRFVNPFIVDPKLLDTS